MIQSILIGSGFSGGVGCLLGDRLASETGRNKRLCRILGATSAAVVPNVLYLLSILSGAPANREFALCWGVHILAVGFSVGLGASWPDDEETGAVTLFLAPALAYLPASIISFFSMLYLTVV